MKLTRAKTDRTDAKMIAWYGQTEMPAAWKPPAEYIIKLQQLEAMADLLIKNRTAFTNQLKAFTATGMLDSFIRSTLKKSIASITKQLQQIELRITDIIEQHHKKMLDDITSVPGVGKKSAVALIVISGGFRKFDNHKKLTSYLGLSPRVYESGTSIKGRSRICKLGMSRIRAMLYVCAWSAKKCNHACKQLYDRLVANGKSKRLALIAVANKLIKQVFAIANSGIPYQVR
jgi:transposase